MWLDLCKVSCLQFTTQGQILKGTVSKKNVQTGKSLPDFVASTIKMTVKTGHTSEFVVVIRAGGVQICRYKDKNLTFFYNKQSHHKQPRLKVNVTGFS